MILFVILAAESGSPAPARQNGSTETENESALSDLPQQATSSRAENSSALPLEMPPNLSGASGGKCPVKGVGDISRRVTAALRAGQIAPEASQVMPKPVEWSLGVVPVHRYRGPNSARREESHKKRHNLPDIQTANATDQSADGKRGGYMLHLACSCTFAFTCACMVATVALAAWTKVSTRVGTVNRWSNGPTHPVYGEGLPPVAQGGPPAQQGDWGRVTNMGPRLRELAPIIGGPTALPIQCMGKACPLCHRRVPPAMQEGKGSCQRHDTLVSKGSMDPHCRGPQQTNPTDHVVYLPPTKGRDPQAETKAKNRAECGVVTGTAREHRGLPLHSFLWNVQGCTSEPSKSTADRKESYSTASNQDQAECLPTVCSTVSADPETREEDALELLKASLRGKWTEGIHNSSARELRPLSDRTDSQPNSRQLSALRTLLPAAVAKPYSREHPGNWAISCVCSVRSTSNILQIAQVGHNIGWPLSTSQADGAADQDSLPAAAAGSKGQQHHSSTLSACNGCILPPCTLHDARVGCVLATRMQEAQGIKTLPPCNMLMTQLHPLRATHEGQGPTIPMLQALATSKLPPHSTCMAPLHPLQATDAGCQLVALMQHVTLPCSTHTMPPCTPNAAPTRYWQQQQEQPVLPLVEAAWHHTRLGPPTPAPAISTERPRGQGQVSGAHGATRRADAQGPPSAAAAARRQELQQQQQQQQGQHPGQVPWQPGMQALPVKGATVPPLCRTCTSPLHDDQSRIPPLQQACEPANSYNLLGPNAMYCCMIGGVYRPASFLLDGMGGAKAGRAAGISGSGIPASRHSLGAESCLLCAGMLSPAPQPYLYEGKLCRTCPSLNCTARGERCNMGVAGHCPTHVDPRHDQTGLPPPTAKESPTMYQPTGPWPCPAPEPYWPATELGIDDVNGSGTSMHLRPEILHPNSRNYGKIFLAGGHTRRRAPPPTVLGAAPREGSGLARAPYMEQQAARYCQVHALNAYHGSKVYDPEAAMILAEHTHEHIISVHPTSNGIRNIHYNVDPTPGNFSTELINFYISQQAGPKKYLTSLPLRQYRAAFPSPQEEQYPRGIHKGSSKSQIIQILGTHTRVILHYTKGTYGHAVCLKKYRRHWYMLDSENPGPINLDSTPLSQGWHQVQGHAYITTDEVPTRQLARMDPHSNEWAMRGQQAVIDLTNNDPEDLEIETHQPEPLHPKPVPGAEQLPEILRPPEEPAEPPTTQNAPAPPTANRMTDNRERQNQAQAPPPKKKRLIQVANGPIDKFVIRTARDPPPALWIYPSIYRLG